MTKETKENRVLKPHHVELTFDRVLKEQGIFPIVAYDKEHAEEKVRKLFSQHPSLVIHAIYEVESCPALAGLKDPTDAEGNFPKVEEILKDFDIDVIDDEDEKKEPTIN